MKAAALGSYPRIGEDAEQQKLRRAIQRFQAGKIPAEELARVQDEVTAEVLREQEEAGLDWLTDGLVRWEDGQTYFTDRLEGFQRGGLLRYFDTNTYYRQPICNGPVRWKEPITVADFRFARGKSEKPVRPVITGPYTLARLSLDEHYRDLDRFAGALAEALRSELEALAEAGAETVQVDEPALTARPEDEGRVRALLATMTHGVEVSVHVALTMGSPAAALGEAGAWPVSGFWLDCVSGGGTLDAVLERDYPKGAVLGLGVMDARNTKVESVDALLASARRAAEKLDPERIALTTSAGLEFLPRDRAAIKLGRLSETVRRFQEGG